MNCEFCDFSSLDVDLKEWTINLCRQTSYKHDGKKYFLEVEYPADGKIYKYVKPLEAYYCPKCGRSLVQKE